MSNVKEDLAALEHEQWAHWTKYMLDRIEIELPNILMLAFGRLACVKRWRRQIETPYEELTDHEKDSDREWSDRAFKLVMDRLMHEAKLMDAQKTIRSYLDWMQNG